MKYRLLSSILLCTACFFLVACAGQKAGQTENIAIVDTSKAMAAHVLYPVWQNAVSSRESTLRLKDSHVRMAQSQAALINKMQQLGEQGHNTFMQADYTVRMTEARLAEREMLEKQRRQEKERIDAALSSKVAAIEEEYRLPLFNLKVRIESINPVRRSRDDIKAEKEKLIAEAALLMAEKAQKINAVYQEGDILLEAAMKGYEEEANRRLSKRAEELRDELSASGRERQRTSDERLAGIPETFSKGIAAIDKQLVEQQLLADKLYNKIYDDIKSQVARIATQKKYTVVFSDVRVNIKATDITDEVIAGLPKKIDANNK